MKKILFTLVLAMSVAMSMTPAFADDHASSSNTANQTNGWAHFDVVERTHDSVTVDFVSTRNLTSCFEYRTDGDTSQALATANPNTQYSDRYPSTCVRNQTVRRTFEGIDYVEIRMVFGGESDERFDWERVDTDRPSTKDECKNGGWTSYGYRNQGECVSSVAKA